MGRGRGRRNDVHWNSVAVLLPKMECTVFVGQSTLTIFRTLQVASSQRAEAGGLTVVSILYMASWLMWCPKEKGRWRGRETEREGETERMKQREREWESAKSRYSRSIPLPLASHTQTPRDSTSLQKRCTPCEMAESPQELQETVTPISPLS